MQDKGRRTHTVIRVVKVHVPEKARSLSHIPLKTLECVCVLVFLCMMNMQANILSYILHEPMFIFHSFPQCLGIVKCIWTI